LKIERVTARSMPSAMERKAASFNTETAHPAGRHSIQICRTAHGPQEKKIPMDPTHIHRPGTRKKHTAD
jgi:hypothetical protein